MWGEIVRREHVLEKKKKAFPYEYSHRVGTMLLVWRKYLGYKQQDVADRANVKQYYWSRVERGGQNLQMRSLERMIKALGLSWDLFFEGPPTMHDDIHEGPHDFSGVKMEKRSRYNRNFEDFY